MGFPFNEGFESYTDSDLDKDGKSERKTALDLGVATRVLGFQTSGQAPQEYAWFKHV